MKNIKGFLFDLDGVLIDSESEYTRIWSEIDRLFPTGVENFPIKIKGMTLPEILHTYFGDTSLHSSIIDELYSREQRMHYEMLPGALRLLNEIQSAGMGLALVTSSDNKKMAHLREEQPDLEGMFHVIVTANSITHSKPHPEGYILAATRLGLLPGECVVCEDSRQGVQAGKAAGSFVVGLTTTLPEKEIAPWCDMIVSDLSEVHISRFK